MSNTIRLSPWNDSLQHVSTSSNRTRNEVSDEPWPHFSEQVREVEAIEKYLAPWLSIISIILNVALASYILSRKDLRKFTFIVVSYQMFVDGLIVCPVNILTHITRFYLSDLSPNNVVDEKYQTLGCYLTAVYNGANITTTSPVLLFLCIERALLVLLPVDGKILMKKFGLKVFVVVDIGTSLVYTSLLVAGSKYDHEDKACSLSLLGLTSSPSAFLFVILFYLVPLSAMLIVYPLIVHRLLTNKMNIPAQRVKANKRISTLLIFSTVAFALLWAPLMVPSLWHAVDSQSFNSFFSQHSRLFQIHAVCNLFIILYSVVNPCIYAMITRPIREPLLQELQNQTQDLIIRRLSCQPPGVVAAAANHNQVHSGSKKTEETPA